MWTDHKKYFKGDSLKCLPVEIILGCFVKKSADNFFFFILW